MITFQGSIALEFMNDLHQGGILVNLQTGFLDEGWGRVPHLGVKGISGGDSRSEVDSFDHGIEFGATVGSTGRVNVGTIDEVNFAISRVADG